MRKVFTCDGADADLAHVGERHRVKDLAIPITLVESRPGRIPCMKPA
jgi:hypothetical protein